MRNEIREKYGLNESKKDNKLVKKSSKAQVAMKNSLEKKDSSEKKGKLTRQKEMANKYNISPRMKKEKCSIMWETYFDGKSVASSWWRWTRKWPAALNLRDLTFLVTFRRSPYRSSFVTLSIQV